MSLRWAAIFVMVFASALNYLDRQLLAAVGPSVIAEFHLSAREFGLIISVFSIIYAAASPLAGLFLDRVGLRRGMSLSVGAWSLAGMATGLTTNFAGLLACRAALGVAETTGIPGYGKANATYLKPTEFALGTACSQLGLSMGSLSAPLAVAWLAPRYGWRSAFVLCGLLGFLWIPAWWAIAARAPGHPEAAQPPVEPLRTILGDRRLWGLIASNMLIMSLYTLWTNWTTLYFVKARGLTQVEANQDFAWIPPVFATLGSFAGGAAALALIRSGVETQTARLRICWVASMMTFVTAAIPLMPTPALAAACISMSFFSLMVMSTNIYSMPLDFFGARRAALGTSALTGAYGAMQTFASPLIGEIVDKAGFGVVCTIFALLPPIGVAILHVLSRPRSTA